MTEPTHCIQGELLAAFAESNRHVWPKSLGCAITHATFGKGTIVRVTERMRHPPLFFVRFFAHDELMFNTAGFLRGEFLEVFLPLEVAQEIVGWQNQIELYKKLKAITDDENRKLAEERRAREDAELAPFRALAARFNVAPEHVSYATLQSLFPLLNRLESRISLSEEELQWLEKEGHFNVLATYYYRCFLSSGNAWELVKTCSYLRRAGLANKSLEISSAYINSKNEPIAKEYAALLTTRGGAFRDIDDLVSAKKSANFAVALTPESFYPYNLLGAISYQEGTPEDGDKYFEKAISLGSKSRDQDAEIRSAFQRSTLDVQTMIAAHLLEKDPKRYKWVTSKKGSV